MQFWKKYFLSDFRHEISFDELLAAMTNEALKLNPNQSEFPLSRDKVHYLHLLFVQDQQVSTVTMERFGRICAVLGPFSLPSFVSRLSNLFMKRWFYGEMPTTTATFALSNERAGTFLLRFANSRLSDFAISRVYPTEGYIHHMHIKHPPESNSFSMACEDIDMVGMDEEQITSLRTVYPSLVALVNGVKDALDLREPLVSIPRLLVGQNVKHNGYFVRAFFSDSEDEDGLVFNNGEDLDESPVESDEKDIITPLLSKDYKRAARLLGLRCADDEALHKKSSSNSIKGKVLSMPLESFLAMTLKTNMKHSNMLRNSNNNNNNCNNENADRSITLMCARARHCFRLSMLEIPSSKIHLR